MAPPSGNMIRRAAAVAPSTLRCRLPPAPSPSLARFGSRQRRALRTVRSQEVREPRRPDPGSKCHAACGIRHANCVCRCASRGSVRRDGSVGTVESSSESPAGARRSRGARPRNGAHYAGPAFFTGAASRRGSARASPGRGPAPPRHAPLLFPRRRGRTDCRARGAAGSSDRCSRAPSTRRAPRWCLPRRERLGPWAAHETIPGLPDPPPARRLTRRPPPPPPPPTRPRRPPPPTRPRRAAPPSRPTRGPRASAP